MDVPLGHPATVCLAKISGSTFTPSGSNGTPTITNRPPYPSPPIAADIASAFVTVARMVLAPPIFWSACATSSFVLSMYRPVNFALAPSFQGRIEPDVPVESSASRLRLPSSASEALVRMDQVLLAGRLLAVDRDLLQP